MLHPDGYCNTIRPVQIPCIHIHAISGYYQENIKVLLGHCWMEAKDRFSLKRVWGVGHIVLCAWPTTEKLEATLACCSKLKPYYGFFGEVTTYTSRAFKQKTPWKLLLRKKAFQTQHNFNPPVFRNPLHGNGNSTPKGSGFTFFLLLELDSPCKTWFYLFSIWRLHAKSIGRKVRQERNGHHNNQTAM